VNAPQDLNKVNKDLVVSMEYELRVDGELVDSADASDPLEFIQGHEHIIPGLEREIEGMAIGESKEVFVKAADAYGEYDPEGFVEISKTEFPADFPFETGTEVMMENEDGEDLTAFIEEVTVDSVTLNFNHPLAGKDLTFNIKINGLRAATDEELQHDHVHCEDDDCCGEDGCDGHCCEN
jgi:FKBP-type peptidyl-prolyl cis-trans isomerase SlyD